MIFCSREEIRMRSSKDLIEWGDSSITILDMKAGIAPESPSLIRYNGIFYLFVCGWNGIRNMSDITGAYQHKTFVFYSKDLQLFDTINQLTVLDAHAPEIFQGEDGSWYISSAEWPNRGVSVSRLIWE